MIHLGTNFLIQISEPGSAAHIQFVAWAAVSEDINASSIAWAEFLCGPLDAVREALARQIFPQPEPFVSGDAAARQVCSIKRAAAPAVSRIV
jgi:predicted nucleic acid-binding protein